jgi:tetratricopeptide (TPR) repeat protein
MSWLFLLLLWTGAFDEAFRAGLIALNRNDAAAAESKLEEAAKLEPGDARVWLALARTYWKLGKRPQADAAAAAAERRAQDPALLHGLAIHYAETGDLAKAADLESRYAAHNPEALGAAAQFALAAGKAAEAIALAKRSLAREDKAEVHSLLGKAYESSGNLEEAVREFRAAAAGNRYEEAHYADLAAALMKQQNFAAALEAIGAGRRYIARSAQFELSTGVAYYGLRRFPEAIDAFLRTIRIDPGVEQPYLFLAKMLDQAEGKMEAIAAAFAEFARRAPDHYLSSFVYAKALAASDRERAEAMLRKSIAARQDFWESHFDLGVLLERKGRFEEAAQEVRRASELNPRDAAAHYRLARLYDRLGKSEEARAQREMHEKLTAAAPGARP